MPMQRNEDIEMTGANQTPPAPEDDHETMISQLIMIKDFDKETAAMALECVQYSSVD